MYLIDALSNLLCVLLVDGSYLIKTAYIQNNSKKHSALVHKCKVTKASSIEQRLFIHVTISACSAHAKVQEGSLLK
jgi:hypothetical protein